MMHAMTFDISIDYPIDKIEKYGLTLKPSETIGVYIGGWTVSSYENDFLNFKDECKYLKVKSKEEYNRIIKTLKVTH